MSFNEKLKCLRKKHGYTQQDIADKIRVTKSVISFYERSERIPTSEHVKKIAEVFGVSTDYLLDCEREYDNKLDVTGLTAQEVEALKCIINSLRTK